MKKEQINENTMRVLLAKEDLEERGISILDLIGNQKDVEEFFYSILDEVDTDHEFRDTGAVTFQLVPKGDGVELFITKVKPEDAERINLPEDAKFGENNSVMLSNLSPEELDDLGLDSDVTDILKNRMKEAQSQSNSDNKANKSQNNDHPKIDPEEAEDTYSNNQTIAVYEFDTFENFIMMAESIEPKMSFISNLFEAKGKFYFALAIQNKNNDKAMINDLLANMNDYGKRMNFAPMLLEEHARLVKSRNAFEWVKYYFA